MMLIGANGSGERVPTHPQCVAVRTVRTRKKILVFPCLPCTFEHNACVGCQLHVLRTNNCKKHLRMRIEPYFSTHRLLRTGSNKLQEQGVRKTNTDEGDVHGNSYTPAAARSNCACANFVILERNDLPV